MQLHLDLVGGLAGDMFIAAMLDAFPRHESRVADAIAATRGGIPVSCALREHRDAVLRGRRFEVRALSAGDGGDHHAHTAWADIESRLRAARLDAGVREHALGMFGRLARAEATVHGIDMSRVEFHEVGAWDSIADIVGAAALIHAVGPARWTTSPIPLGSGRIRTAHGVLPVPAPATVQLLLGLPVIDDGIPGERVTPTGAAILAHLLASPGGGAGLDARRPAPKTLCASGTGFGERSLPGLSNHVRVLCFEELPQASGQARSIDVIEFEVDDQSGEDLALGLERLRAHPQVLDVTQTPVFGKKCRMMAHVRVLARRGSLDAVATACFRETTTIGLRHRIVEGIGLDRVHREVEADGAHLRVKLVDRPGGRTAKAESDDLGRHADHAARAALRIRAERLALDVDPDCREADTDA